MLYGAFPSPVFTFSTPTTASDAVVAAIDVLLTTTTEWVGESDATLDHSRTFFIGYDVFVDAPGGLPSPCAPDSECIEVRNGVYQDFGVVGWKALGESEWLKFSEVQIYADFTPTTVVPIPAAVWLFGSGLLGLIGVARRKVRV